jgi:hypothetical protein
MVGIYAYLSRDRRQYGAFLYRLLLMVSFIHAMIFPFHVKFSHAHCLPEKEGGERIKDQKDTRGF